MKQFLYLDYDIVNSIVAQKEKGLIDQITTENRDENGKQSSKKANVQLEGEAGANILKLAKAGAWLIDTAEEMNCRLVDFLRS